MVRLGLLANPDAGLGGRLGLKGSDGQAELARSMGAEDRSGPRLSTMLEHFSELRRAGFDDIEWLTSEGRMGTDLAEVRSMNSSLRFRIPWSNA